MRKSMHHAGSTIDKKRQGENARSSTADPIISLDKDKPQFAAWLDQLDEKLTAYKQRNTKQDR